MKVNIMMMEKENKIIIIIIIYFKLLRGKIFKKVYQVATKEP